MPAPNPYQFISKDEHRIQEGNTPEAENNGQATTPQPMQLFTRLKDKYLEAEKNPHVPTRLWVSVAGAFVAGYFEPFVDYHFIGAKIRLQTGLTNPTWWKTPISYYLCASKGITSFQASVVPGTVIQVGIIDTAVNKLKNSYGEHYPASFDCVFSVLGGVVSAFVVTPLDHMILTAHHLSENGTKIGPWKAFGHLVQNQGYFRPWTALQTTMIREGGYSLGIWGLNKAIYKRLEDSSVPALKNFSPVFAGMFSAAFTEPFDVTGRIMQKSAVPSSMLQTMKMIYQEYGLSFFWRGIAHRTASIVGATYLLNMITNESKKEIDRIFPTTSAMTTALKPVALSLEQSNPLSLSQSLGIGSVLGLVNMGINYPLQANGTFNPVLYKSILPYFAFWSAGVMQISVGNLVRQQWVTPEADSTLQYAFGGFVGGIVASIFTTPVDNISRQMKQNKEYANLTFMQTTRTVLQKQGVTGLYPAATCAALSSGIATVGFFSLMPKLRENIGGHDLVNVPLAGLVSGVVTAGLTQPFEAMKAAQQCAERSSSIKVSTQNLGRAGLFGGLSKGFGVHCARSTARVTALGFLNQSIKNHITSVMDTSTSTPGL